MNKITMVMTTISLVLFEKQNSDEYYNLNFIKPQSDEHTQLFLEYFKYFNAEIKKQHRRFHPQCSPLDDVLSLC